MVRITGTASNSENHRVRPMPDTPRPPRGLTTPVASTGRQRLYPYTKSATNCAIPDIRTTPALI